MPQKRVHMSGEGRQHSCSRDGFHLLSRWLLVLLASTQALHRTKCPSAAGTHTCCNVHFSSS